MLELIASQAAISLEQARLYGELADVNKELNGEIEERRRAEEALRRSEGLFVGGTEVKPNGKFRLGCFQRENLLVAGNLSHHGDRDARKGRAMLADLKVNLGIR
jgi:GAF domain-containing protein